MKIKFIKNTPGFGYAYMEGMELNCEKPFAKEMIELGVAVELEEPDGSDLPNDFPAREALKKAGVMFDEVKVLTTVEMLTSIEGIGKKSAENILKYLK